MCVPLSAILFHINFHYLPAASSSLCTARNTQFPPLHSAFLSHCQNIHFPLVRISFLLQLKATAEHFVTTNPNFKIFSQKRKYSRNCWTPQFCSSFCKREILCPFSHFPIEQFVLFLYIIRYFLKQYYCKDSETKFFLHLRIYNSYVH